MVGREDRQPLFMFAKNAAIGLNLKKTPEIVDSKLYHGIQLADVFASAMSYIMLNRTEPQAAEWLARLLRSRSINSSNIMPDEDRLDLSSMDGFVNCLVL
jgi:hypothetical protein